MTRSALAFLFVTTWICRVPAADGQSFEVASVKLATAGESLSCSGGPGTADPGLWRCSNMPLGLGRFDFILRVPAGTTNDQFDRMLQNLLKERFKLLFHYQQKEMPIYKLTVAANGPKMKQSPSDAPRESEPWWVSSGSTTGIDKDGYPVFSEGANGLANSAGHCRWTASNVSTADIAKTLSDQSNRPVVDATGLKGTYDVDLKWVTDLDFTLSERGKAEIREMAGELPDGGGGPTLVRAVQEQLGLRLNSTRGPGEIVVVDHVENVPSENRCFWRPGQPLPCGRGSVGFRGV
jgi:uncharacterized protein (TIGR03435 family)